MRNTEHYSRYGQTTLPQRNKSDQDISFMSKFLKNCCFPSYWLILLVLGFVIGLFFVILVRDKSTRQVTNSAPTSTTHFGINLQNLHFTSEDQQTKNLHSQGIKNEQKFILHRKRQFSSLWSPEHLSNGLTGTQNQ